MNNMTSLEKQIDKYRNSPWTKTEMAALRLSHNIETILQNRMISRVALAKRSGLDPSQITRILSGEHHPNLKTLGKIAAGLEVEIWDFFDEPVPQFDFSDDWDSGKDILEIANVSTVTRRPGLTPIEVLDFSRTDVQDDELLTGTAS